MSGLSEASVAAACSVFGWPALRPVQREVVDGLASGRDVVAVLPTSAGKSGTYQVPALAWGELVVVVSPLVALMRDQVSALSRAGVTAHALHSHLSVAEKREALRSVADGSCRLLYCSPERLQGFSPDSFPRGVRLWAVDEAHCISEWGHDFRPAYQRVGRLVRRLCDSQVLALTATATPEVITEIEEVLSMSDPVRVVRTPDRPNVDYSVVGSGVSVQRMVERAGCPCLVYGQTRLEVEDAARELAAAGYSVAPYHAGLPKAERSETQERFVSGELDVVTATCAFGMGIDYASIRSVIHVSMVSSLEAFLQESGRAGRDGRRSLSLVRATTDGLDVAERMTSLSWPEPEAAHVFWRRLLPLFDLEHSWYGRGTLQKTSTELASLTGFDPVEVGSFLRALERGGSLEVWPERERPMEVHLHAGRADRLRGRVQRAVYAELEIRADDAGVVRGSVAWFRDSVGLTSEMQHRFYELDVARCEHGDSCQVLVRLRDDLVPLLDEPRMRRLRERALERLSAARGYLYSPGCRRAYLLDYFESSAEREPDGVCCDRCYVAPRYVSSAAVDLRLALENRLERGARAASESSPATDEQLAKMLDWYAAQLEKGSLRGGVNVPAPDEQLVFQCSAAGVGPETRRLALVLLHRARNALPPVALSVLGWTDSDFPVRGQ